ncbi:MAG: hypothetical protein A2286_00330 [Gammaproteobacteria bacterium RIFOXYA12_FULL_61_12]|nr:MAG: hypothetical protein A2514_11310 [Gammaproteobacteria bacterium RIFOXYD12_FULL_61_37]OGT94038.1 MAG: hypothetical protein A2286_00330 [Gammaproteobacteria bacterium RIFOXYA12_FULL_61_12]
MFEFVFMMALSCAVAGWAIDRALLAPRRAAKAAAQAADDLLAERREREMGALRAREREAELRLRDTAARTLAAEKMHLLKEREAELRLLDTEARIREAVARRAEAAEKSASPVAKPSRAFRELSPEETAARREARGKKNDAAPARAQKVGPGDRLAPEVSLPPRADDGGSSTPPWEMETDPAYWREVAENPVSDHRVH